MRRVLAAFTAALCALMATSIARADEYPSKPIRLVLAYPAGGSADPIVRTIADGLSKRLKQAVFVENRTGGNATIATQYIANAAPDGYTLYFTYTTPYTMLPFLYRKLSYDPKRAYTPISLVGEQLVGFGVPADSKFRTLKDMFDEAKLRPGELSHSSSGTAQIHGLTMEQIKIATATNIVHVPYQGSGPAVQAAAAKQVDMVFADIGAMNGFVRGNRMRLLAVAGQKRNPNYPEVPTMAEAGLSGIEIPMVWHGIVGPPGMPKALVDKLNAEINAVVRSPEFEKVLTTLVQRPLSGTPEDMQLAIDTDERAWGALINRLGIRLD
jgi:tripartite-type tricarboxylate transporter receptor subunit TctC